MQYQSLQRQHQHLFYEWSNHFSIILTIPPGEPRFCKASSVAPEAALFYRRQLRVKFSRSNPERLFFKSFLGPCAQQLQSPLSISRKIDGGGSQQLIGNSKPSGSAVQGCPFLVAIFNGCIGPLVKHIAFFLRANLGRRSVLI